MCTTRHQPMWLNPVPYQCSICGELVRDTFIDGVTVRGPWAIMCQTCHRLFGRGLGIGRGQRYTRGPENRFHRVEG